MKIVINGVDFNNAKWDVEDGIGKMAIYTNSTIAEIIDIVGENNNIDIYDDDNVLVSKWYNSGIIGINCTKYQDKNYIEVRFSVSILDTNTEAQIQGDISESVDAIMELAEIISDMDSTVSSNSESITFLDKKIDKTVEDFNTKTDDIENDLKDKVKTIDNNISTVREKANKNENDIAELDSKVNGFPSNIIERFDALWASYNALADRVARLENKQ